MIAGCSKKTMVQNNPNESIATMIDSQRFIFKANTAIPARGRTIQLTSDYTLRVTKDSVIADLPYFGRAYTAPIGRIGGGIEFTTTRFSYKKNQRKNGGYEIEIIPEREDVQRLFLSISGSGYGSLNVTSQNRQGITFNGFIEPPRK